MNKIIAISLSFVFGGGVNSTYGAGKESELIRPRTQSEKMADFIRKINILHKKEREKIENNIFQNIHHLNNEIRKINILYKKEENENDKKMLKSLELRQKQQGKFLAFLETCEIEKGFITFSRHLLNMLEEYEKDFSGEEMLALKDDLYKFLENLYSSFDFDKEHAQEIREDYFHSNSVGSGDRETDDIISAILANLEKNLKY